MSESSILINESQIFSIFEEQAMSDMAENSSINLTDLKNWTFLEDQFNMTNLNSLEDILGNFKQNLLSSVDLSFSVFYSLVRKILRINIHQIFGQYKALP